jgi:hypothetical protein
MTKAMKSASCIGALSLVALAGQAYGQNCANGVIPSQCSPLGNCNGPDVIVGDITGPSNYLFTGSLESLSLGTTSCNIGNVWLNWFQNTNQHPAIGGNLFKMKTANGYTTFEQVGQSWLKHGFFALSTTVCCSGCQSTDGTHLGIHCADPYSSDRNGSQAGLGPKYQVNAHTGVFTYPPANPTWSGNTARRLEVAIADLEVASTSTPNVSYFGQAQYITPDDAAAGNQNNNCSYRRIAVSGSGTAWNFSFIGNTIRALPAIRAWHTADSAVTETDIQIANDGLFVLSSKATDLGGGTWHYEYALYNLNSDRSGQDFSVPLPDGATATNIGFHDVDYRNGDGIGNVNFSGTDWTATRANNKITWATQTFAQNPSANALRWGTLYNFRFDANVAPLAGTSTATFTLFKPGAAGDPTSGSGDAQIPGTLPPPVCACDFNHDLALNSQDFFDFLSAFFAGLISADFNASGIVDSQDFFDFLNCFFTPPAGC